MVPAGSWQVGARLAPPKACVQGPQSVWQAVPIAEAPSPNGTHAIRSCHVLQCQGLGSVNPDTLRQPLRYPQPSSSPSHSLLVSGEAVAQSRRMTERAGLTFTSQGPQPYRNPVSPTLFSPLLSLSPDCKFNCHKRCATRVPNDCLGEAFINGGKRLGLGGLEGRAGAGLGGDPSDPCPPSFPPDVPMEEATDFSEADKSALTEEPDDSGVIPGSHSENALHTSEEEDGEEGKAQR